MEKPNETIADIIAEARDKYTVHERAEAALMREKAAIEADALEVGGIVAATAAKSSATGDAAKLRGALKAIDGLCAGLMPTWDGAFGRIKDMAEAALAAPARNCDRFASAEEAWDAYDEWVESYRSRGKTEPFNEFGWLFAPATEQERRTNGQK